MITFLKRFSSGPLGWLILFVLVVGVAYGVFVWSEDFEVSEVANVANVDEVFDGGELPEGIRVVDSGEVVKVVNSIDGYEVEVAPSENISYEGGMLNVEYGLVEEEGTGGAGFYPSISIVSETTNKSMKEWAQNWIDSQQESQYYAFQRKETKNDREYGVIYDKAFFGGPKPYALIKENNKILFIDSFPEDPFNLVDNIVL